VKLYDTSYIFEELKKGNVLSGYILDLTLYEFLNVLWKHVKLLKLLTKEEAVRLLRDLLDQDLRTVTIQPEDMEGILEIAIRNGVTAYDAAYVYYSKKLGIELKTLDRKLLEVYKKETDL